MNNEIIQIKYGTTAFFEKNSFDYKIEKVDLEFESEEERIKAELDQIEEEKLAKDWSNYWQKMLKKGSLEQNIYTVKNNVIRYERNQYQLPEEFIQIIPETGEMLHFFKNERTNLPSLSVTNLHHNPASSDWKIDYRIKEYKSIKQTILGFECHKMIIEETKINEKENWKSNYRYDLFVTDKINLPARLIIHLWDPITEMCALEIKTINLERPNSIWIQRAIEISNNVDEKKLELPEEYTSLINL